MKKFLALVAILVLSAQAKADDLHLSAITYCDDIVACNEVVYDKDAAGGDGDFRIVRTIRNNYPGDPQAYGVTLAYTELGTDATLGGTNLVYRLSLKANTSDLSVVAFSDSYTDLTDKPSMFSGSYSDLTGKPSLATVATTGVYDDLTGKPSLFSGAYVDLTGKPTLFSGAYTDLTGKPTLFSGAYSDLTGKPTIPAAQIQSDWAQASTGALDFIKNKPTLAAVASTGAYSDLAGKPTIPVVQAYEGTTQRLGAFFIYKSATVSSGTATVNFTNDGTSTGTTLCTNGVIQDSVNVTFNDATHSFQQSWAWSNSNKTLTVTANQFTSASLLSGLLGQAAANGSVAKVSVMCY